MARTTSYGAPQRAGKKTETYLRLHKDSHVMSNRDLAEILGVDEKVVRLAKTRLGIPQKEQGSGQLRKGSPSLRQTGAKSEKSKKGTAKLRKFTTIIQSEGGGFVSLCPELDIASQGDTIAEARNNLREALDLFFECASSEEKTERLANSIHISQIEVAVG